MTEARPDGSWNCADAWAAIVSKGPDCYRIGFEIDPATMAVTLEDDMDKVKRKTAYIEAKASGRICLNGEVITAGAPMGNRNAAKAHQISRRFITSFA